MNLESVESETAMGMNRAGTAPMLSGLIAVEAVIVSGG